MRLFPLHKGRIPFNELLCRSTAAAQDVDQSLLHIFLHLLRHHVGCLVIKSQRVGKSCIRVGRNIVRCLFSQQLQERFQLARTKRAVQSDGEDVGMLHTRQESLQCLSRKCTTSRVAHRDGKHQRKTLPCRFHRLFCRIDGSLGIERIKDGFDEQGIHAPLDESLHLLHVGIHQFIVSEATQSRIVHIGRDAQRLVRRTHIAQHKTRFHRCFLCVFIRQLTGNLRTSQIHLTAIPLHVVISHRHPLRREGASGDEVGSCLQILPVNVGNHVGTGQAEDVIVALHQPRHILEPFTSEVLLLQSVPLNHGAHRTVQNQNFVFDDIDHKVNSEK